MCRLIRESAEDPAIRLAAEYARHHYGCDSADPAALAWACFFFAKHKIKFVVDEAPMFRLNEPGQQDLLISPAVLVRMDQPQEDCDGFTMLICAMLRALGVAYVIVTIACSPDDPSRWSHVFPVALCPGGAIALDASHGSGPGWMVPASHIFRWQAWDADGNPVQLQRPRKSGLHGWVPSSLGLGQDGSDIDPESGLPYSQVYGGGGASGYQFGTQTGITPWGTPASSTPTTSPSSSNFNLTSFLNNLATQAAGVARVAETSSAATSASLALSGMLQNLLPIVLVVVAGGFIISAMSKK